MRPGSRFQTRALTDGVSARFAFSAPPGRVSLRSTHCAPRGTGVGLVAEPARGRPGRYRRDRGAQRGARNQAQRWPVNSYNMYYVNYARVKTVEKFSSPHVDNHVTLFGDQPWAPATRRSGTPPVHHPDCAPGAGHRTSSTGSQVSNRRDRLPAIERRGQRWRDGGDRASRAELARNYSRSTLIGRSSDGSELGDLPAEYDPPLAREGRQPAVGLTPKLH